jgi:hypothetical protein
MLEEKNMKKSIGVIKRSLALALAFLLILNVTPVLTVSAAKTVAVTKITLKHTTFTMEVGWNESFGVTIEPSNATDKTVTWSSSDPSVASVDNKGGIKALKPGKTTITVKSKNGKEATCVITVIHPPVRGFTAPIGTKNRPTYNYSASVFDKDATEYSHVLASFCATLSAAAYNISNVKSMLKQHGFTDKDIDANDYKTRANSVAYSVSRKDNLVIVAVRGTIGTEWYTNFDIAESPRLKSLMCILGLIPPQTMSTTL